MTKQAEMTTVGIKLGNSYLQRKPFTIKTFPDILIKYLGPDLFCS